MESYAGISPDKARQTFKIGLAVQGTDAVSIAYKQQSNDLSIKTIKSKTIGLEVTQVVPANKEVKHFYDNHPAAKGLKALGKLRTKTWEPPYRLARDLTGEERIAEAEAKKVVEHYEFLIEDYILDDCFVGMKLETTVHEMSFGLRFFDLLYGVHCSFYDVLPNEVMAGWKDREPENLPMRQKEMISESLEEALGIEEGEGEGGDGKEDQEAVW